jgi:hypothetical protein
MVLSAFERLPAEMHLKILGYLPMVSEKQIFICLWPTLPISNPPPYSCGFQRVERPDPSTTQPVLVGYQLGAAPVSLQNPASNTSRLSDALNIFLVSKRISEIARYELYKHHAFRFNTSSLEESWCVRFC